MNLASLFARCFAPFAILVAFFVVATSAPAVARGGDGVVRSGSCSSGARWKVKVGPDNGRLEVEGEVDSNRAGQSWRWSMRHNGILVTSGSATTAGRSGSFEVRRLMTNRAGTDTVTFYARRPATGQSCSGVVRF